MLGYQHHVGRGYLVHHHCLPRAGIVPGARQVLGKCLMNERVGEGVITFLICSLGLAFILYHII